MLFGLFRSGPGDAAHAVYGSIVAQARQPGFYLDYAVPDTVEGRFEMILLHATLMFDRLKDEAPDARRTAQEVLDVFFSDMDRSLREMGVGDMSIGKKMKKLGRAYAGRSQAYGRALEAGDADDLAAALGRCVQGGAGGPAAETGAARLARYAFAARASLAAAPTPQLLAADVPWPAPAAVAAEPDAVP